MPSLAQLLRELVRSTDDLALTADHVEDIRRTKRRDIDHAASNGLAYEDYLARLDADEHDAIHVGGAYHHDNLNYILDRRHHPEAGVDGADCPSADR